MSCSFPTRNRLGLVTIFVEHPVIFMGYSLNDKNIISLLRAICACIGQDKLQQLNNNLIFVQRTPDGEQDSVSPTIIALETVQIPITLVKAGSFTGVYEAIGSTKRKFRRAFCGIARSSSMS